MSNQKQATCCVARKCLSFQSIYGNIKYSALYTQFVIVAVDFTIFFLYCLIGLFRLLMALTHPYINPPRSGLPPALCAGGIYLRQQCVLPQSAVSADLLIRKGSCIWHEYTVSYGCKEAPRWENLYNNFLLMALPLAAPLLCKD